MTISRDSSREDRQINSMNDDRDWQQFSSTEVEHISLLEEKLQVTRRKQKVGEIVIRKQVETRMVQVPIRREKLIIEKTGKNPERLAEVVVGEKKVNGFKYEELSDDDCIHSTKSSFVELKTAQELLEVIAQVSSTTDTKVRLEISTNSAEYQEKHQDICDRF